MRKQQRTRAQQAAAGHMSAQAEQACSKQACMRLKRQRRQLQVAGTSESRWRRSDSRQRRSDSGQGDVNRGVCSELRGVSHPDPCVQDEDYRYSWVYIFCGLHIPYVFHADVFRKKMFTVHRIHILQYHGSARDAREQLTIIV